MIFRRSGPRKFRSGDIVALAGGQHYADFQWCLGEVGTRNGDHSAYRVAFRKDGKVHNLICLRDELTVVRPYVPVYYDYP